MFLENRCSRSSSPEVFLWQGVLKIPSKFTGEDPVKSDFNKVSMQLIEITLHYRCSPVFSLHIFRTRFHRNTPGRLLLVLPNLKIANLNQILERYLWRRSYFVKLQALLKNELLLNTYFKEHLWWTAHEDFLYHTFYISIHVKIIQSLNYCPHYLMFRLMKNWNISLIVEYMEILRKSTSFAVDIQVVWKESSDAFLSRSLLLTYGCWLGFTERLIMQKQVALVHHL